MSANPLGLLSDYHPVVFEQYRPGALQALTQAVDQQIETKNEQRRRQAWRFLR